MTNPIHDGKRVYETHREAKRAARWMRAKHGQEFKVYRCKFCKQLHIGRPWNGEIVEERTRIVREWLERNT